MEEYGEKVKDTFDSHERAKKKFNQNLETDFV